MPLSQAVDMLRSTVCCLALLLTTNALLAQRQPSRERPAVACDMSQRIISVTVVDRSTGALVEGATVAATRVRTKAVVTPGATMGSPGIYYIVQDGELPELSRAGEPLRIVVSKGERRVVVNYTIGLDARGCHVDLRGGPKEIKL
jgi:hypothetical protein